MIIMVREKLNPRNQTIMADARPSFSSGESMMKNNLTLV